MDQPYTRITTSPSNTTSNSSSSRSDVTTTMLVAVNPCRYIPSLYTMEKQQYYIQHYKKQQQSLNSYVSSNGTFKNKQKRLYVSSPDLTSLSFRYISYRRYSCAILWWKERRRTNFYNKPWMCIHLKSYHNIRSRRMWTTYLWDFIIGISRLNIDIIQSNDLSFGGIWFG